ncbi:slipin family protein [Candidatus Poribacteria bacterium]|nr:slipin family protein [Candidatus Poribacteria bacterium]MYG06124.1 slipin family protein [Candidatus Poribacteria bacterium]MYK21898.1 slipin family protein [Candidatus Poribacteria bacterium]
MLPQINPTYFAIAIVVVILLATSVRILKEYERAVIFRLGRLTGTRGPGLVFMIPFWIERMQRVSLRLIVNDVTPQDVITKDNVSVSVNAVLNFRIIEADKAVIEVEDFGFAISQIAQTTLRSVLGRAELDDLLSEREKLNQDLENIVKKHCEPWGIEVLAMEIKDVDLPVEMQRAMAQQAEAERERRAKVIHAEGEFESAQVLTDAADILSKTPTAVQLRFLQALVEVSAEKNSTIVFPIPIDLLSPFLEQIKKEE